MEIDGKQVIGLIELRGIYDGWSIAVLEDGTRYNRWAGREGEEHRAELTEAFIRGEGPNEGWF